MHYPAVQYVGSVGPKAGTTVVGSTRRYIGICDCGWESKRTDRKTAEAAAYGHWKENTRPLDRLRR